MYQSREVQVSEQTLHTHLLTLTTQWREWCAAEQSQEALTSPLAAAPLHHHFWRAPLTSTRLPAKGHCSIQQSEQCSKHSTSQYSYLSLFFNMQAPDFNFPHWKPYSAPKDSSPGAFSSPSSSEAHVSHQSGAHPHQGAISISCPCSGAWAALL